ncbi:DUF411 domain-containing protein [Psychrobacter aestuarii]|uniref:DUF411 domain-containing protein n=1 Tax=Psychrobacter aestuarii TaxID=556327 RepID=A0ABP3FEA8_9GAMM|nr:DUF411 domain-containing protein [Psychrobacter aestuarii]
MSPRKILLSMLLPATLLMSACDQAETPKTDDSASTTEASSNSAEPVQAADTTAVSTPAPSSSDAPQDLAGLNATVYKDANCGCCGQWVDYAGAHGMTTQVQHPVDLSAAKDKYGVPQSARSCHTTVTDDGYVFEGHIPAKYVAQFLANPPKDAKGLAVAGMPMGSPGMEYQNKFDPYDVLQINNDGSTEVYAHVENTSQQM